MKEKAQQFVVNVSEEHKTAIQQLKEEYDITDKGVMTLLLEVALEHRQGMTADANGEAQTVDRFAMIIKDKSLGKKSAEARVKMNPEEREQSKLQRQLLRNLNKLKEVSASKVASKTTDDLETLIEIGV